jgi:hypothetical protein
LVEEKFELFVRQQAGAARSGVGLTMTKYLPPSLLALFAPRPPLPFKPPVKAAKHGPMRGVAAYVW